MQIIEICRLYELDSVSSNITKVYIFWCSMLVRVHVCECVSVVVIELRGLWK